MKQKDELRRMVYAGLFAALAGAGSLLAVPIGPVPVTLQAFFVFLPGLVLGARWGFISISLYLLLGIVGFPVYAGGSAGIGHLLGPTAGYLFSFPIAAGIIGYAGEMGKGRPGFQRLGLKVAGGIVGLAVNHGMGVAQLMNYYGMGLGAAVAAGSLPFIVPDLVKLGAVVGVSESLGKYGIETESGGPDLRGNEERSFYGTVLGIGLVMSGVIPWAYIKNSEGLSTSVTGISSGGSVTLTGEEAEAVVTGVPSLQLYGVTAMVLGVVVLTTAFAGLRWLERKEIYTAVVYASVGVASVLLTAVSYSAVSSWELGATASASVGYGVYLVGIMGLGLVGLGVHTVRSKGEAGVISSSA
ncbi:MAG: biotin transporter BioY [Halobacteria archaeon]|nr:biotin transporter BioY [Halobacteria archaeon]